MFKTTKIVTAMAMICAVGGATSTAHAARLISDSYTKAVVKQFLAKRTQSMVESGFSKLKDLKWDIKVDAQNSYTTFTTWSAKPKINRAWPQTFPFDESGYVERSTQPKPFTVYHGVNRVYQLPMSLGPKIHF